MGWKSTLATPIAKILQRRVQHAARNPHAAQQKILDQLRSKGQQTAFGKEHGLAELHTQKDLARLVPVRDYEGLKHYFDRVVAGEEDVLWPGRPAYFAKTSGTTSGVKYIPITKDSLPNHFGSARNALFNYFGRTGKGQWLDGKMIFLSGSPKLDDKHGVPIGRLSGISNHLIPAWVKRGQLPSYETNCIEDWETKLDAIVKETVGQDLRLISGIPPWVQMYFERLLAVTGKTRVLDIFPNFSVFVYGGVNYEPYRAQIENLIGGRIDSVETFPASEGFIAFQDGEPGEGLLLNVDSGIYFEFVPLEEADQQFPTRLSLREVELGKNYALVLSSNAGLWGYAIGDTVEFVSLNPFRIKVSGRVKHYISAFGEHVIGKEVEAAMHAAVKEHGGRVTEFHVAPQVNPPTGEAPYHEWFIEFAELPSVSTSVSDPTSQISNPDFVPTGVSVPTSQISNLTSHISDPTSAFAKTLDLEMQRQNIYYADLIEGKVLQPLKITVVEQGAFRRYMESQGKLGGQNKVPRLGNDRKVADVLG